MDDALSPRIVEYFIKDNNSIIDNEGALLKILGDLHLIINHNYYDSYNKRKSESYFCSLKDYINECKINTDFNLQCTEFKFDSNLEKLFKVNKKTFNNLKTPESRYFYAGFKGAIAPIHFDWDMCNVYLTQITGRKRIVLFEPKVGKRLFPISNTSTISLHNLSNDEQRKLIEVNKGQEFILEPGQTLFIPKLWWHFVEYLDLGTSINYRFGNTQLERRLINLPRHHLLQCIMYYLCSNYDKNVISKVVDIVLESYYKRFETSLKRYNSMKSLYKELYSKYCQEAIQGDYIGDNFDFELTINKLNTSKHYNIPFNIKDVSIKYESISKLPIFYNVLNYLGYSSSFGMGKLNLHDKCTIVHTYLNGT